MFCGQTHGKEESVWACRASYRKSWVKGSENTTTIFPTGFYHTSAWSPIVFDILVWYVLLFFFFSFFLFYSNHQSIKIFWRSCRKRQRLVRMRLCCSPPYAQWSISRHSGELLAIIWGFQMAVKCEVSDRQRGQLKLQGTNIAAHYFVKHRGSTAATNTGKSKGDREKRKSQFIRV